jgi:hypothetical protein
VAPAIDNQSVTWQKKVHFELMGLLQVPSMLFYTYNVMKKPGLTLGNHNATSVMAPPHMTNLSNLLLLLLVSSPCFQSRWK